MKQFREMRCYLSALKYNLDFFSFSCRYCFEGRFEEGGWMDEFYFLSVAATFRKGTLLVEGCEIYWWIKSDGSNLNVTKTTKGKTPSPEIKIIVILLKGIIAIARSIYTFMLFYTGEDNFGKIKKEQYEIERWMKLVF